MLCARGVQILNEYFGSFFFFFLTHFTQLLRFTSSGESEQMMTDSCVWLRWLIFIASLGNSSGESGFHQSQGTTTASFPRKANPLKETNLLKSFA